MNRISSRISLLSVAGAALLLAGCATTDSVEHAQASADAAMAQAQANKQTADAAMGAAQSAQQTIDQHKATEAAQAHRGERD